MGNNKRDQQVKKKKQGKVHCCFAEGECVGETSRPSEHHTALQTPQNSGSNSLERERERERERAAAPSLQCIEQTMQTSLTDIFLT